MADYTNRLASNVPGPWYVDSTCIDCDLCRETAPQIFRRDDEAGSSIVAHQPQTETEKNNALEAMDECPTNSIGNDAPAPGSF
jgi:ferredoxin